MLCQYLYISTAPSLAREQVESILSSSARNNPELGVTGLLLYNGRNFLQLLEGDDEALKSLMMRIGSDPRHTGVSLLANKTIERRSCPEWAMKRMFIAEPVESRKQTLEAELPTELDPEIRKMIVNFAVLN